MVPGRDNSRTVSDVGLESVLNMLRKLRQALMNLMLNGIEAMKETGGLLTVKSQLGNNTSMMILIATVRSNSASRAR